MHISHLFLPQQEEYRPCLRQKACATMPKLPRPQTPIDGAPKRGDTSLPPPLPPHPILRRLKPTFAYAPRSTNIPPVPRSLPKSHKKSGWGAGRGELKRTAEATRTKTPNSVDEPPPFTTQVIPCDPVRGLSLILPSAPVVDPACVLVVVWCSFSVRYYESTRVR